MPTTSIFDCTGSTLTKYRGRRKHLADFPSGIDTIGSCLFFERKSLESVVLPQGLTTIGTFSFMNCTNLKSIVIPPTVTAIGMLAFAGCESLESISIPDLKFTGVGLFEGCKNLKRVCLPAYKEEILVGLLCDCKKLEKVELNDGSQVNLETIKKKGAQVRRLRAKAKRDGECLSDRENWAWIIKRIRAKNPNASPSLMPNLK